MSSRMSIPEIANRLAVGRIAVGGPADLVVVDGQPDQELAVMLRSEAIVEVWRSGTVVS